MSDPAASRRVLAADVGGTRSRLALFVVADDGELRQERAASYATRELDGAEAMLVRFLDEVGETGVLPPLAGVCFGVAGPVQGNRARLTSRPDWEADGAALGARLGAPVEVVNDLVASALGVPSLGPADLLAVKPGVEEPGAPALLLGVGTGLGMALLVRAGSTLVAVPSEGGHVELAARDERGWRLRGFLAARFAGRVSAERVVSGTGLRNLYDFLLAEGGVPAAGVARRLAAGDDAGAVIGEAGLARSCPLCVEVLELFADAFGAVAGDAVLTAGARGGVFLGGGVAGRLAGLLVAGRFQRAFRDKGRLYRFVEGVPVRVVLRPDLALLGAARRAAELAG